MTLMHCCDFSGLSCVGDSKDARRLGACRASSSELLADCVQMFRLNLQPQVGQCQTHEQSSKVYHGGLPFFLFG
jgi:hypothetical protein